MNPIKILPIKTQVLRKSILSNYAQRFVLPQVKSTYYILERFFVDISSKDLSATKQKLKSIGIEQIGNNVKEGIIIKGDDCNYHVYSPNGDTLGFDILKHDSNEVLSHFCLNNRSSEYVHSKNFDKNAEDSIIDILDYIDKILLEAKNKFIPSLTPQTYVQKSSTSDMIEKLNKTMRCAPKHAAIKDFGYIDSVEKEIVQAIINKIIAAQKLYNQIPEGYTRSKIKQSYEKYIPQGSKHKFGFRNAGPSGEDISLYYIEHKKNYYLELTLTNADGNEKKFIINEKPGTVQRNLPYRFSLSGDKASRIYAIPDYYTQKEIEKSDLYSYLKCTNQELESFLDYSKDIIYKRTERNNIRNNVNSATLNKYKYILDDIAANFKNYKMKMRKLPYDTKKRNQFKTENNISTKYATTAVRFDNITTDGKDLRLSLPKVCNTIATQILVMQGDTIEKSYFIYKNRLLRFSINGLNDKIRSDSQTKYFYDENYLEESNLEEYLILLKDKLHELNKKLDEMKKK